MNRPLPSSIILPKPPDYPEKLQASPGFRDWLGDLTKFGRELVRALTDDLKAIHTQINTGVQGIGADISTTEVGFDGSITPLYPIVRVTGAGEVNVIKAPEGFSGPVFLISAGGFSVSQYVVDGDGRRTGNIALDLTTVTGQCLGVIYNPVTELWHPLTNS